MTLHALEQIVQIASDWLWETDEAGRFTYLSAEAEHFLGRPSSALLGRTRDELAFEDENAVPRAYRQAIAARAPFRSLIYTYRHPDGAPRWFEISGRPMLAADGTFLGYRGVGSDVSDEHRTRDALVRALAQLQDANSRLVEQNRRFDAALENMTQGLCMFDADSRLLVWNRRYLEIFGLPDEALAVGTPQRAIIERLVALKRYKPSATVDSVSEGTRTSLAMDGGPALRELADGRVIAAMHRPMAGGGWVATFEDVTERRRNEARISHMARHDALTDLPNRTTLREIGTELIAQVEAGSREAYPRLAVLCLDLDRFKPVNDSFGHAVGDMLLRAVAERLRFDLRGDGLVARFGGDEFAVLYRTETADGAVALAQRLIRTISAPYALGGYTIEIGMSVGIALSDPQSGDIDRLLKNADMALYEAKAAGRGLHCVFEQQMDETARERAALERELRQALAQGRFELHYQPLVEIGPPPQAAAEPVASDARIRSASPPEPPARSTRSKGDLRLGRINGVEALARWRHPERGLVSPAVFIPLAEETGLIVPLGAWILHQACRDAAAWPDDVIVAVNVSALQLRHRGFAQTVMTALSASGLKPSRLELEITESVLLDDTEANLETLHTLRRLGVRIAMDDFGTGYSSISYLRRFPFDKIKIDRSFVRDAGVSADAAAIVRAIVGLGSSLGMTTLVEGIETEAQLAAIRAEGAQEMQGFLFSAPRPASEIGQMLSESGAVHLRISAAA